MDNQPVELSPSERAKLLLNQMTTEEKVDQLRAEMILWKEDGKRDYTVGHSRNIAHFLHHADQEIISPSQCAAALNEDTALSMKAKRFGNPAVSYTHIRAHETVLDLV